MLSAPVILLIHWIISCYCHLINSINLIAGVIINEISNQLVSLSKIYNLNPQQEKQQERLIKKKSLQLERLQQFPICKSIGRNMQIAAGARDYHFISHRKNSLSLDFLFSFLLFYSNWFITVELH